MLEVPVCRSGNVDGLSVVSKYCPKVSSVCPFVGATSKCKVVVEWCGRNLSEHGGAVSVSLVEVFEGAGTMAEALSVAVVVAVPSSMIGHLNAMRGVK
ncbi:hypothetical protein PHLCEN_2v5243 [Hermanssonia centrifuga]|uniref:Uncharacterized protein n=1 Tax=Hermanssonia centrifuga TaxID=98765 RepID=A0A2R6P8Q9_9APHY|nr:hypothetical protein PHLCEN_2v5243 [Hermanssonia centrifuga]